ncbi:MAG: FKBP-type peptidyl-prolyl cis-trans isomerase [Saprospiraceae bacterium]|nr:FKBP-type peptidyl-prolyl cis-trans isomerase [Bacteroidia bacterium]NNF21634.1 FKBP-type peptidyl-prolyl cis-trans isomerase [Saprospiraceae bacterium]
MKSVLSLVILFITVHLNAQMDTTSYSVGMIIAKNLKAQGISEIDQSSFNQAIADVFADRQLAVSLDEANNRFKSLIEETKNIADLATKREGMVFLESNGKRPEVTTTDSGLQYEVLNNTTSGATPGPYDKVKVHYHGTLIDGTVFDSSVERQEPISFPLNGVIQGWQEGLQLMKVGDKFRFFIPYDLAYGERAAGPVIKPYSTLIFDVELLGIE